MRTVQRVEFKECPRGLRDKVFSRPGMTALGERDYCGETRADRVPTGNSTPIDALN